MTRHREIVVPAVSWNLFHGRDSEGRVRRELLAEFGDVLAGLPWQVAMLQECPPRWVRALAARCDAGAASALTSRNQLAIARSSLARHRPDLMRSGEGGCNALLWRAPWRLTLARRHTLARLPERRRMVWARLDSPGVALCVANLHATAHDPGRAAREVESAARLALGWAGPLPLLFGGDLNLRPRERPDAFARLGGLGFRGAGAEGSVDHLLAAHATFAEPPHPLAPEARAQGPLLSDHAPLQCALRVG